LESVPDFPRLYYVNLEIGNPEGNRAIPVVRKRAD
jgi:hypothetical protein